MTEHKLKNPYISIERNGKPSYGGGQQWSDSSAIRKCGCGPVGGLDVLLYLSYNHSECGLLSRFPIPDSSCITENLYLDALSYIVKHYLPIIPPFGMNGFVLAGGLNLYFSANKMPFKAHWGVPHSKLWDSIAEMLDKDIPVIFSVGPNFPRFWQKNKVPLYRILPDGSYKKFFATKAHFVTVTAMDDVWLCISSWGRRFYINKQEYMEYVKAHSNPIVSNIVVIGTKNRSAAK